ncbi:MAG: OmcA/MtrC family decaheme c-type cytochrome [Proteobacteria bacterium]|nr:OmcA/MtrC family decaheme c-type cytochrome [Pseudomonadota bacterium]
MATSAEPAGTNCPNGGTRITVGIDSNGNGTLDASEVTSTTYTCDGGGKNALVTTSPEDAGANCPFGGTKIETGLDANNDGVLDASEVNAAATSYVCNIAPSGTISPSTGIVIAYKDVSTAAAAPITVRFTLKDDRGFPLDLNGNYSVNTVIQPRFAIGYFTKDATSGLVSPLTMYTKSASTAAPLGQPTNLNPLGTSPGHGTLVENGVGAGDYTYTFPTTATTNGPLAVAYDDTKLAETHVVWIQASRQTDLAFPTNANTFAAANAPHYFVPASPTATPLVREIASQDGCNSCHAKFKPETLASAAFHGGGRVNVGMCNVCHNPGRTTNPLADTASFIHRIHNGEKVATANQFHGIAATYPRDIRNCDTCHGNAAQGDQALSHPSTLACKGCHDYVSFDVATTATLPTCQIVGNLVYGSDGKPVPCNHAAGPKVDSECAVCHGPTAGFATAKFHKPVAKPDPNNSWLTGGTNANTNASYVAAGGYVPANAEVITYDLKTVDTVVDGAVKRPRMVFKLMNNGADVVFQDPGTATELMPNFIGSPSAYFAFAVPQDGNTTPSDFNASVSGYIKKIWNNTATGTGAGTLTGPVGGYYTLTLTGVVIPASAKMLTGGLGYTYSLSSAPPLVQTNVPEYQLVESTPPGKPQGGLSVPAANVWKVATGYTGRRPIVDNAKCKSCHGALGVSPTFHAGQRNDGPTCSFCHNPNPPRRARATTRSSSPARSTRAPRATWRTPTTSPARPTSAPSPTCSSRRWRPASTTPTRW